MKNWDHFTVSS